MSFIASKTTKSLTHRLHPSSLSSLQNGAFFQCNLSCSSSTLSAQASPNSPTTQLRCYSSENTQSDNNTSTPAPESASKPKQKKKRSTNRKKMLSKNVFQKLLVKPNKLRESSQWIADYAKPGLQVSDVTEVSSQYNFNPNDFYKNVEQSVPQLKEVQNAVRQNHTLFTEDELDKLSSAMSTSLKSAPQKSQKKRALVDQPQVKQMIQENIKRDATKELEKPFRPTGNLVFVTLIRSANHQQRIVKKAAHQLGLRKTHQTQVHADSPMIRGFLYTCRHLVHVQIVPVTDIFPRGVPPNEVLPEYLRTEPSSKRTMQEKAIVRSQRKRATKRDYSHVEQKYAHLQKESQKVLQSVHNLEEEGSKTVYEQSV